MTQTQFTPWPDKTRQKKRGKSKEKDKVVEAITNGGGALVTPAILEGMEPSIQEAVQDEDNVAFKANPGPQSDFLAASEREVLMGGGKGSGKTYVLMVDPLRYCGCKHTRALLLRRTIPDVRDIIHKAKILYPKAYPGVEWKEQDKSFVFPSGARIEFGFAENLSDLPRYQGQNYTYVGIDEIADFPFAEELLTYIRANIRTVDPINAPPLLRLTANPGAVSSAYIKKEFIDSGRAGDTFWITVPVFDPRTQTSRVVRISKKYIHSTVFDNEYLLKDDSYLATLAGLPETKRKQWLAGDWDVAENAAFSEFDDFTHVTMPINIPRHFKRIRGMDWGYSSQSVVLWGYVTNEGQLIIYREWVFSRKDAATAAQEGRAKEMGEEIHMGVLDSSAWQQRGTIGESIGETLQNYWGKWVASSRSRIGGKYARVGRKNLIHEYLAMDPMTGEPRLKVFNTCRNLIKCLKGIPLDKNNVEMYDTDSNLDHAVDALGYLLQARPSKRRSWTDWQSPATEAGWSPQDNVFGY